MLRGFVGALYGAPRKTDWRRFYDFVIYAHARGRRDAFLPDDVRVVLREHASRMARRHRSRTST
jgi:hypothetical protein